MRLQGSNILSRKQVDLLKKTRLNFVWFPKGFERIYQQQYRQEAAYEFRYRGMIIFIGSRLADLHLVLPNEVPQLCC